MRAICPTVAAESAMARQQQMSQRVEEAGEIALQQRVDRHQAGDVGDDTARRAICARSSAATCST